MKTIHFELSPPMLENPYRRTVRTSLNQLLNQDLFASSSARLDEFTLDGGVSISFIQIMVRDTFDFGPEHIAAVLSLNPDINGAVLIHIPADSEIT